MDKELIKEAVKEVFKEEREKFGVPPEQHYQDHEFIVGVRDGTEVIKKTSLRVATGSAIAFFGWALWNAIKEKIWM